MKLTKFSVSNYKVFSQEFTIEFKENENNNNFTILTGRNNTGKSTLLEALYAFFLPTTGVANRIDSKCFTNQEKPIEMSAEFQVDNTDAVWGCFTDDLSDDTNCILTISKEYTLGETPVYKMIRKMECGSKSLDKKEAKEIETILKHNYIPFYIKPTMTVEEINNNIKTLYIDVLSNQLKDKQTEFNDINVKIKKLISDNVKEVDNTIASMEVEISNQLQKIFPEQKLELKLSGSNITEYSLSDMIKGFSPDVRVASGTKEMQLDQQGTGVQRMSLIFTIQQMILNSSNSFGDRLLLIDEPEAFLHPEAVRILSRSLYEIGDKIPTIITTHSPVLINLENPHTHIDVLRVDNDKNNPIQLFSTERVQFDEEDDKANIKILNYVDSYINEFFFSEKNIIVEGATEKMFLNEMKKQYKLNFHIIEARGKTTIVTLMKILNQFDTDYYVLHDLDNKVKPSYLKGERQKCHNIFNQKSGKSKIFATNDSFEPTFYGDKIPSRYKTKRALEIINSIDSSENYRIKMDIFTTFKMIFDFDVPELQESSNSKIIEVDSLNKINEQFEIIE